MFSVRNSAQVQAQTVASERSNWNRAEGGLSCIRLHIRPQCLEELNRQTLSRKVLHRIVSVERALDLPRHALQI